jgi:hypothetical protein
MPPFYHNFVVRTGFEPALQALGVVILYIHRTEPTLSLPCLPVVGETPLLHLTLFSLFQYVKELIYFDTSNIVLSFDGKK